jgi:hypothetical protein
VFSIGVGTTPIPCPTRQDELMAKMGEKYPSKLMVLARIFASVLEI